MVVGMILALSVVPGALGTQEAIHQSQQKERREEHRARRCNLTATCVKSSLRSREINSRQVVLRDGKLYIDTGTSDGEPFGHPFAGYYLPYPDEKYEGLVSTITEAAPVMNWIYVDKKTYEVKYGIRKDAQPNFHGPFDCTRQDRRLTFEKWEGFVAVEEHPTIWALYFDRDDNGLKGKVAPGIRVLEIELSRKEKRWKRDLKAREADQTIEQTMANVGEQAGVSAEQSATASTATASSAEIKPPPSEKPARQAVDPAVQPARGVDPAVQPAKITPKVKPATELEVPSSRDGRKLKIAKAGDFQITREGRDLREQPKQYRKPTVEDTVEKPMYRPSVYSPGLTIAPLQISKQNVVEPVPPVPKKLTTASKYQEIISKDEPSQTVSDPPSSSNSDVELPIQGKNAVSGPNPPPLPAPTPTDPDNAEDSPDTPTNPHEGSQWSTQGNEDQAHTHARDTPASSIQGDDSSHPADDGAISSAEPTPRGPRVLDSVKNVSGRPVTPNQKPLTSPLPMPPILEEDRSPRKTPKRTLSNGGTRERANSMRIIDAPHPLSRRLSESRHSSRTNSWSSGSAGSVNTSILMSKPITPPLGSAMSAPERDSVITARNTRYSFDSVRNDTPPDDKQETFRPTKQLSRKKERRPSIDAPRPSFDSSSRPSMESSRASSQERRRKRSLEEKATRLWKGIGNSMSTQGSKSSSYTPSDSSSRSAKPTIATIARSKTLKDKIKKTEEKGFTTLNSTSPLTRLLLKNRKNSNGSASDKERTGRDRSGSASDRNQLVRDRARTVGDRDRPPFIA